MYLKCTYALLYLITTVQNSEIDCMEGEMWFEPCRYCKCLKNGTYTCKENMLSCRLGECIKDVVVFQSNFRCHCANDTTICVPLLYQHEMNGKSCSGDYYFYDSCTICYCDVITNTLQCFPVKGTRLSVGGICTEGEIIFEKNCYKCDCTFTKFRKCVLSEDCFFQKEKPGHCYIIQRYYQTEVQFSCLAEIMQECYGDYECPGQKKCCHVVDCYLRCVDPVF